MGHYNGDLAFCARQRQAHMKQSATITAATPKTVGDTVCAVNICQVASAPTVSSPPLIARLIAFTALSPNLPAHCPDVTWQLLGKRQDKARNFNKIVDIASKRRRQGLANAADRRYG
ncbi:hypothetical protein [Devosia sp.]|uniref:hypothetical protein n=1 Tax=Devosia sp. TaxID=1871048 RepID=UPI003264AAB2